MCTRDIKLDIVKGLAMSMIVLGHACAPFECFYTMFHVSIFYIVAGILFKPILVINLDNICIFISKKFKRLALPFILINLLLIFLHNCLINCNLYTVDPRFLQYPGSSFGITEYYSVKEIIKQSFLTILLIAKTQQLAGATWFLKYFFYISIIIYLYETFINFLFRKINILENYTRFIKIILAIIIFLSLALINPNIKITNVLFIGLFFYYFAFIFKDWIISICQNKIGITFFIIILFYIYLYGNPIASDLYFNFKAIIIGFSGFIFTYFIATIIYKIPICSSIMSIVGQHTFSILLFHLIFFKFVTIFQLHFIYTDYPKFMYAAFPIFQVQNFWWLVYTVIGILSPILLSVLYKNLYNKISSEVQCHKNK